jgi:hypothetical protein
MIAKLLARFYFGRVRREPGPHELERQRKYWEAEAQKPVTEYIRERGTFGRDIDFDKFVLGDQFPDISGMSWTEYEKNVIPLVEPEVLRRWGKR